jgi:hypothetical protein
MQVNGAGWSWGCAVAENFKGQVRIQSRPKVDNWKLEIRKHAKHDAQQLEYK